MIKKNFILLIIFLFFLNGCGYSPVFSKKTNFSIIELAVNGDKKINKIIINRLNNYKESKGERFVMSIPSSITRPVSGFSNPPSILSNVVLPEPEDPKRPKNSDFEIFKLIFSKTLLSPKDLEIFSITRKLLSILNQH